jgi:hypothetical protein
VVALTLFSGGAQYRAGVRLVRHDGAARGHAGSPVQGGVRLEAGSAGVFVQSMAGVD